MVPALIIIAALVLVGAGIALAIAHERKRTEGIRAIAEAMGFAFHPKGDASIRSRLSHFHLFSQGHSKRVRNMMHGEASGIECAILDYQYTTGSGRSSHTWRQSVMCFWSPKLALPSFSLRPEHIFHKIGSVFGYQDIDFEGRPAFSSAYLLRGKDEEAVRRLFDDAALSFYEGERGVSTEGEGDCLVYFRPGKRVKPYQVRTFMEDGFRVFGAFASDR